jgi:hypothetical protein
LYKNQSIKTVAAALMLLLFALSVTPKQLLHDAITGHKHSYSRLEADAKYQASKNNFKCNWHNQVIASPFIDQGVFQIKQPVLSYSSYINHYTLSYYSTQPFFSSLRGPPCQV